MEIQVTREGTDMTRAWGETPERVLVDWIEADGVAYELWGTPNGGGTVRVVDLDSDNLVSLRMFQDYTDAEAYYRRERVTLARVSA